MKQKFSSSSQNSQPPSSKSSLASEKQLKIQESQRIPLTEVTAAIEQQARNSTKQEEVNNPEEENQVLEFKLNLSSIVNNNGNTKEFYQIILENYLLLEKQPRQFIGPWQGQIAQAYTESQRIRFIDWTVEIIAKYNLNFSTFYIIQTLLDQFQIVTHRITFNSLHLTGMACIYLASKINDVQPLNIDSILRICTNQFNGQQIQEKELEIFSALQFKLNFSNSFLFLTIFLRLYLIKEQQEKNEVIEIAYFTLKLTCFNYQIQTQFTQSEIAAGCFYYAFVIVAMQMQDDAEANKKISEDLVTFLKESISIKEAKLILVGKKIEQIIERYLDTNDYNYTKYKFTRQFDSVQSEMLKQYDQKRVSKLL